MKNFVSEGKTVTFTAGAAYTSGDVVPLGKMAGIAANDIANGAVGVAVIEGEFNLAKTTGTAYAIGDLLDWDVSAAKLGKAITPASGDIEDCQTVVTRPLEFSRSLPARLRGQKPCKPVVMIVPAPPVQLQADRARE